MLPEACMTLTFILVFSSIAHVQARQHFANIFANDANAFAKYRDGLKSDKIEADSRKCR